jgi:hypothetical protein
VKRWIMICALGLLAQHAHAAGVTTCTKASAVGTDVYNCLNNLVFQPPPLASTTLVLVCPQGSPGLQNQALCPGNVWEPLSSTTSATLIGYCNQAVLVPYTACDYPKGAEGFQLSSSIFGTPQAPPPPTVTGAATISWNAPALNTNGTAAAVVSYQVQYGQTDFSQTLNTTARTATFANLPTGLWQFRVVAISLHSQSAATQPITVNVSATAAPTPTPTPTPTPLKWVVSGSGSQPLFEAVLPMTGAAMVRGNQDGTIVAGKPCGAEAFKVSSSSYRAVQNSDSALASPTYASRSHVAICVQH